MTRNVPRPRPHQGKSCAHEDVPTGRPQRARTTSHRVTVQQHLPGPRKNLAVRLHQRFRPQGPTVPGAPSSQTDLPT
eukprot:5778813-Pyramimonas_sp.AAC.1